MAICCCYTKNDGTDAGCSTQVGPDCFKIEGYIYPPIKTEGACVKTAPLSEELALLIAEAEKCSSKPT